MIYFRCSPLDEVPQAQPAVAADRERECTGWVHGEARDTALVRSQSLHGSVTGG